MRMIQLTTFAGNCKSAFFDNVEEAWGWAQVQTGKVWLGGANDRGAQISAKEDIRPNVPVWAEKRINALLALGNIGEKAVETMSITGRLTERMADALVAAGHLVEVGSSGYYENYANGAIDDRWSKGHTGHYSVEMAWPADSRHGTYVKVVYYELV